MLSPFTLYLDDPVVVGKAAVLGYDKQYKDDVIDFGTGELLLQSAQRAAWDAGREDRFTESELKQIKEVTERLRKNE